MRVIMNRRITIMMMMMGMEVEMLHEETEEEIEKITRRRNIEAINETLNHKKKRINLNINRKRNQTN
jgi:hypothetical protein